MGTIKLSNSILRGYEIYDYKKSILNINLTYWSSKQQELRVFTGYKYFEITPKYTFSIRYVQTNVLLKHWFKKSAKECNFLSLKYKENTYTVVDPKSKLIKAIFIALVKASPEILLGSNNWGQVEKKMRDLFHSFLPNSPLKKNDTKENSV